MDEFDINVGRRPQIEAPTIAKLMRRMNERDRWQQDEQQPLAVDAETFRQAEGEMKQIMERQGRVLASAGWINRPNFLLRGTPVVIDDYQD